MKKNKHEDPLSRVRTMLFNSGWVMVLKTSSECWTDGRRILALVGDEVIVNSPTPCVMSIAKFLEGGGPK